jgi:hypothetical protein
MQPFYVTKDKRINTVLLRKHAEHKTLASLLISSSPDQKILTDIKKRAEEFGGVNLCT